MSSAATELTERLDFAIRVAADAGELILKHYQASSLKVDVKSDSSPVTVADRGAEQLIRDRIGERYPEDGVLGEEFDDKASMNGYRWILDPLDGTKSFIHGVPLFGTLIGLEFGDQVVLGVCRFPALDEVVFAAEGQGTWWQIGKGEPRRSRVSNVSDLSAALFCTTTITGWQSAGQDAAFQKLCQTVGRTRGWGDCYGHILVATGRAEIMVDPRLNEWDAAALVPIAQEAGGHFVDWEGNVSIYSGNGLTVNAALKAEVLEVLRG